MNVKPDGFFGATMAIEGIEDSTVLMHGPDGCRKNMIALTQKVFPRKDPSVSFMTPYYRGSSRIPCTDLEPCDYIYGAYDRVREALEYIREREPAFVAVVCSPGASLIGDDCQKAIDEAGLSDRAIVIDAEMSSRPICNGIDGAMTRVMEKLDPEKAPIEEGTAVLLGNHVLNKDWEAVNEEMCHILGLMGIRVICCVGAGSSIQEMRESVRAEYAVVLTPEYATELSRFYAGYGAKVVMPDYSPVGFQATEDWINKVAEASGRDPAPALAYVDKPKRRAYRGMATARFSVDTLEFAVDAEPSIAYPLTCFLYKGLQMYPVCVRFNGMSHEASENLMREFLEERGMADALGADMPDHVDVICTDGNTANLYQRSNRCLRGLDLRFPSMMNSLFLQQPIFGAQGALYILERVVNRFRGRDSSQRSCTSSILSSSPRYISFIRSSVSGSMSHIPRSTASNRRSIMSIMAWGFSSSIHSRVSSSNRYASVSFSYIQSSTMSDVASHPKVYSVRLATSATPRYPWRFRPSMNFGLRILLR